MIAFENWSHFSTNTIITANPKHEDFINAAMRSSKRFKLIVDEQKPNFLISISAVYSEKTGCQTETCLSSSSVHNSIFVIRAKHYLLLPYLKTWEEDQ